MISNIDGHFSAKRYVPNLCEILVCEGLFKIAFSFMWLPQHKPAIAIQNSNMILKISK